MTSLTVDECVALVPTFEAAFLDSMATWTLHGRRRQARRYTTYLPCPLPTPEDRLLFILVSLKQHPTPLLHGRVFGMRQSKAPPWIHVLLPVLRNALRTLGEAPCRSVEALRSHLEEEASLPGWRPCQPSSRPLRPPRPPFCHDGTERPIPCPTDAVEQKTC